MKLFSILPLFFVLSVAFAQTGQTSPHKVDMSERIFDDKRDAANDIANAIKLATKQNKHILLDVGGNWCSWCHKLDFTFTTNKDIAQLLKKYVVVKVNWSRENENKAVLANYPKIVTGFPHLFVLDKTGKLIQDQDSSLLESGDHHDPDKIIAFLTKWK